MSSLISSILKNSVLENRIQNAERELTNLSELLNNQLPKYETWLSTKKIRLFSEIQKAASPMWILFRSNRQSTII